MQYSAEDELTGRYVLAWTARIIEVQVLGISDLSQGRTNIFTQQVHALRDLAITTPYDLGRMHTILASTAQIIADSILDLPSLSLGRRRILEQESIRMQAMAGGENTYPGEYFMKIEYALLQAASE